MRNRIDCTTIREKLLLFESSTTWYIITTNFYRLNAFKSMYNFRFESKWIKNIKLKKIFCNRTNDSFFSFVIFSKVNLLNCLFLTKPKLLLLLISTFVVSCLIIFVFLICSDCVNWTKRLMQCRNQSINFKKYFNSRNKIRNCNKIIVVIFSTIINSLKLFIFCFNKVMKKYLK